MSRRERAFAVLPTLLTLSNALCGFAAITYAAKIGIEDATTDDAYLLTASMCIFGGMLFDALDGRAARWANQTSEFGAQLDSLCDVVTFGVAPAFLMRQFCLQSVLHPRILWVLGGLYVACAILRLARFTIETDEDDSHDVFSGLPSPAAAGVIASFPVAMYGLDKLTRGETVSEFAKTLAASLEPVFLQSLPFVTLAVACLMVSRIRYSHVFNQLFTGKRSRAHLIQIVFTGAVIFSVREMAVPLIFCYFAFASPARALWQNVMQRRVQKQTS